MELAVVFGPLAFELGEKFEGDRVFAGLRKILIVLDTGAVILGVAPIALVGNEP